MLNSHLNLSSAKVSNNQESSDFLVKEKRLKKIYEITLSTRNFEIGQLIQRNNFFMIFQGVLLACMISSKDTVPFVQFTISCAGFYISYCQTKVAAGAKFWQEYWEDEVYKAEDQLQSFYKYSIIFEDKNLNKNVEILPFIPLFTKLKEQVYNQVFLRLHKKSPDSSINTHNYFCLDSIELPRFFRLLFLGETLKPNIFSTNKLILEKPSVSKIPIHVGQCLIIIWALLALSCLGVYNQIMEWKPFNDLILRGLPTHKESVKQEIYFSHDNDKTAPLHLANDHERNDKKEISGSAIPIQIDLKNLHQLSQNNEVFLNIHIDGKGNTITSYKVANSDSEVK